MDRRISAGHGSCRQTGALTLHTCAHASLPFQHTAQIDVLILRYDLTADLPKMVRVAVAHKNHGNSFIACVVLLLMHSTAAL